MEVSAQRRQEIVDALRRGTVPRSSLGAFAVGLDRFEEAIDQELQTVAAGGSVFKAVRGGYGCGKTFFSRWLCERGRKLGMASAEVQISETETPLYRLETVYRRLMERLSTADTPQAALRNIIDGWLYTLEEDIIAGNSATASDPELLKHRTAELLESRLARINASAPTFSAAIRAYREAQIRRDVPTAEGLIAWLSGQPNVGATVKRSAGLKGDVDHFGALSFLQGLLLILRDTGHPGLVLVLDEVETIQRMRGDVRDKSLNALRQFIDEIDSGRFPGLYLLITGTPAFFESPMGVARLEPLAQRLNVDFQTDPRFDNSRAVQVRLTAFDIERLCKVGLRVRDIYLQHSRSPDRIAMLCPDAYVRDLAQSVAGHLGGKVGIAPRIFLKKLVADVLDRVDQFADFDPRVHYSLTISDSELTSEERNASAAQDVDDIELDT